MGVASQRAVKAILLDLDDTLLCNDIEPFLQAYFESLTARVSTFCPPTQFMRALNSGSRAMLANDGQDITNIEAFNDAFFRLLDCDHDALVATIMSFYHNEYEALQAHTSPMPKASELVELCLASGFQVAIATQPMFPLAAIKARLRWAGVGPEVFAYDWITSYETSRACKPHPQFFLDIVKQLGRTPAECLMVGDSLETDMAAGPVGLKTFWINEDHTEDALPPIPNAQGNLGDLIELLNTGKIHEL